MKLLFFGNWVKESVGDWTNCYALTDALRRVPKTNSNGLAQCAYSFAMCRLKVVSFVLVVVTLLAFGGGTFAQTSVTTGGAIASQPDVRVEGFRSANFGMDTDAVRAAIEADFGLAGDAVMDGENPIERTQLLTIMSPDVLEKGGIAQVSYVFGYKSEALIQVGVSWNAEADPSMTEAMLVNNGDILRNYFLNAGYIGETIETGTVLDNGILLFRGEDAAGRTTVLLLQGQFANDQAASRVLVPNSLALIYTVNADDPDVFRIRQGDF